MSVIIKGVDGGKFAKLSDARSLRCNLINYEDSDSGNDGVLLANGNKLLISGRLISQSN